MDRLARWGSKITRLQDYQRMGFAAFMVAPAASTVIMNMDPLTRLAGFLLMNIMKITYIKDVKGWVCFYDAFPFSSAEGETREKAHLNLKESFMLTIEIMHTSN